MKTLQGYLKELDDSASRIKILENEYITAALAEMQVQQEFDAMPLDACSNEEADAWTKLKAARTATLEAKKYLNFTNNRFRSLLVIVKALTARD